MVMRRRGRGVLVVVALLCAVCLALLLRFVVFPPERIPRDAVWVPRDAATLSAALLRVGPGGTIVLDGRRGPFAGPFEVAVSDVTIRSYGARAVLRGVAGAPALAVRGDRVTLRGFVCEEGSGGVLVASTACRLDRVAVRGADIGVQLSGARDAILRGIEVSDAGIGVEVASSSAVQIDGARLHDLTGVGLRLQASRNVDLRGVAVSTAPTGVAIDAGSSDVRVTHFSLDGCPDAGLVVRASTAVRLEVGTVRDAGVGVLLDRAADCEVVALSVERAAIGLALQQSLQNAVRAGSIRDTREAGVRLTESPENAISGLLVRGSAVGLMFRSSDRNLVTSNDVAAAGSGLWFEDCDSSLVLRNVVRAETVGIRVVGGSGSQVLQNRVAGAAFGIAVAATSAVTILRNVVERAAGAALAVLGGAAAASLRQNDARASRVGFLAASGDLLDNATIGNEIGFLFFPTGTELRAEGNRIEHNGVGVRQTQTEADLPDLPEGLGSQLAYVVPRVAPSLTNNRFRANRTFDAENGASAPLVASGNRWSSGPPRLSGDVRLDASAWKGDIVLGADASAASTVVGAVLQTLLEGSGYRVIGLVGLADATVALGALAAADLDLTPEAPADAVAGQAAFPLSATAGWAAVVAADVAARLTAPTLSALSTATQTASTPLVWAIASGLRDGDVVSWRQAYGLSDAAHVVVWAKTLEEAESLLAFGAVSGALLPALEEKETASGFVALADDRHALPSAPLAIVARTALLTRCPEVAGLLSHLSPHLTSGAIHELVNQVRWLNRTPSDVAAEFLAREGLLEKE